MQKNKNIPIDHSDRWELFLQGICIKFLSMKLYVFLCFTPAIARGNFLRQLTSGYDPTKLIPAAKRGDPRSYLVRRDSVTGNLCHFPWCARGWVCAQSDERMLYTSHTHTYCEFHECRFVPEFSSRFFHLPDNVQLYYAIYQCTWGEFQSCVRARPLSIQSLLHQVCCLHCCSLKDGKPLICHQK